MTFPITLEAFVAHQEAGIDRELTDLERKAAAAWISVFNYAYEDGKRLDYDAVAGTLGRIDDLLHGANPALYKFLTASRYWIALAFDEGRRS